MSSSRFLPTVLATRAGITTRTVVVTSVAGIILAGCSAPPADSPDPHASTGSAQAVSIASPADSASSDSAEGVFSPVTVTNCGMEVSVTNKPESIITLNQGATESLLALKAEKQMVGTAYLDDEIDPSVADAYHSIPVLAEKYPSHEQVVDKHPDLLVASYASAYAAKAAGTREELKELGIATYLDPFACDDKSQRPKVEWSAITSSVEELGRLTGNTDEAEKITAHINEVVSEAEKDQAGKGKTVFWWDSKTDAPFAGAGGGGPQLLLTTVGATNIFADLDGGWADTSWEAVLKANPDYIVVADASWDTAQSKIDFAKKDPSLKELDAVKKDHFIVVPFSESTPNVRTVHAVERLLEGLSE